MEFKNPAAEFIYYRTYSRWIEELGRRENWPETVKRYLDYIKLKLGDKIPQKVFTKIEENVLSFNVMPSMRFLWAAGPPAEQDNTTIYNCSFAAINKIDTFAEALYILMCGSGFGFSVEEQYINQLPEVPESIVPNGEVHEVEDSKAGWADSVKILLNSLYSGIDIDIRYNKVRLAGERLKTMGGRACLTGDTRLYKDRKKSTDKNTLTISELYDIQEKYKGGYRFNTIKLRCLDEATGSIQRNNVLKVVDNGIAPVYSIVTEKGYKIKATSNHRFMSENLQYKDLSEFTVGEKIAVNGVEVKTGVCLDCGTAITRRAERCKPCYDETQKSDSPLATSARQRKECRDAVKDYCELCDATETRFEVHHIDKNVLNNDSSNLLNLCSPCHQRIHAVDNTFGNPYSHKYLSFDKITYITYEGAERVFDLQMAAPNHNFIANGFVSHNSGPGPLAQLHSFIKGVFYNARGRKLTCQECHDILCEEAQIVVVGGVRRSSLISLSDVFDSSMRNAKSGNFPIRRYMSNNSAVYYEKPEITVFMNEWASLINSMSGERGIFNLEAAKTLCPKRRNFSLIKGGNPCFEIMLRSEEFCNLSEIVTRQDDNIDSLLEKVETATWMGIIQSCFTYFPYLNPEWKKNCEEERLLGVSITGQLDSAKLFSDEALAAYKAKTLKVAKKAADIMGIPMPAAITCVKPSGTVSQLVDSASGLHPRFAKHYIRRYRISSTDPLFKMIKDQGLPVSPENGQRKKDYNKALKLFESEGIKSAKAVCSIFDNKGWDESKVNTWVVSFPVAAPKNAITTEDITAIDQLEWYKKIQKHWCEHNASITVYVRPDEWLTVGDWVYKNWEIVNGVSFLPLSDHVYEQAPYEKITKEKYEELIKTFPKIDYTQLSKYEKEDNTEGAKALACAAGMCEI
jgi:ribonucleoside-triphosphate reductase